ncbi:hypothetical protein J437_LFUL002400 [Ladona fulva]|uniref:Uncharacterized protein n=1 Tax=Ladona fulva TaxID=123851 RepID=A0A8K0NZ79_LADFU|nr:hypothetical protein J437_LFUL002400 [Ladona fulva]
MLPSLMEKELRKIQHHVGVLSIPSGSGRDQTIAVQWVLEEWGLNDKVQAFCRDKTATNIWRLNFARVSSRKNLENPRAKMPSSSKGLKRIFPGIIPSLHFVQQHLHKNHPRVEYRELLELTVIYLGVVHSRCVSFKIPGAPLSAR